MMWPFKKNKDITIPQGKSLEIGFGIEWIRGKEEVVIITDKEKFVLNGKNELFLEITSSNAGSIKVQIVPDFKKKVINIVEILDLNATQAEWKNKGKILLTGVNRSKDGVMSIDESLKMWDENIEIFGKKIERSKERRNIFLIFGSVAAAGNAYLFTINNSPERYLNIIATIIIVYASFHLWNSIRGLCREYEKYKELRLKAFEITKSQ